MIPTNEAQLIKSIKENAQVIDEFSQRHADFERRINAIEAKIKELSKRPVKLRTE